MRHQKLEHRFVTNIPRQLDPGVIYISMEYATAAHRCCCGCGEEVVTPLTPHDWALTFDGETVSLWPSIGNWNMACRSHYVIEHSRVRPMFSWSDRQVEEARRRQRRLREADGEPPSFEPKDGKSSAPPSSSSLWLRFKESFRPDHSR